MRYCPFFVIDNAVSRVSPPFVCFADTSPNKVRGGKSALCYNYAKKGFTCYAFFVAANFAFKTLRKRKVQLCAVAAPLHKNLFSENIFVRNMVILICAGALKRKGEPMGAKLLPNPSARKTERRAALRRTLGFSKKSSDCFRQFEKNRTRKGINNAARKVAPFRSGTQFVACDLSR